MSVRFWPALPAAERRVTWAELFFDLVFVAAVAQVGAPLAAHYSFAEVGRYAFLLLVIWWAWNGYAVYATRFDGDAEQATFGIGTQLRAEAERRRRQQRAVFNHP